MEEAPMQRLHIPISRRRMTFLSVRGSILGLLFASAVAASALPCRAEEPIPIKVATLAPEGTTYIKLMRASTREIENKLNGRVKFTIYCGGCQGEEKVTVQKMKTGQLHGTAVSVVGLSTIAPDIATLNLPLVFSNKEEVVATREAMANRFSNELWENGYKLVGWGDAGFFYLFSAYPIRHPDDLKKGRVWVWNADPVFNEMTLEIGVSPIPLGVADVLSALNTGQVDTVLMNPFALVSLQWFTRIKYQLSEPILFAVGALLIDRRVWEKLTPNEQDVFLSVNAKWSRVAREKLDRDNRRAIEFLRRQGIEVVTPSEAEMAAWKSISKRTWARLVGHVYSEEVLAEMLEHRDSFRSRPTQ
jgi:TRAP-type C4-dicarboxylate transport system substrate-binding protein